jgi:hypothetical protein
MTPLLFQSHVDVVGKALSAATGAGGVDNEQPRQPDEGDRLAVVREGGIRPVDPEQRECVRRGALDALQQQRRTPAPAPSAPVVRNTTRSPSGEMNGLKWCTRDATARVTSTSMWR